jgi:hypothetical protein
MKKFLIITLVFVIAACLLHSCKKDNGNPPVLPPAESMTVDFSNFESGKKSDASISYPKGTQTSNWEFAAGVAMIWKLIIYTTLAVPVKSFQLAVDNVPKYLSDKTWQWSYNATIVINQISVTYKARLTGQIRTNDVQWKMYISKEGANAFSEFVWFEGTSKLDGKSGQWILNQSSQNQVPIIQIDWTRTGTSGTIKYTYIKTGDPFKDSYIEYGLTTNTLNAYYTIHYYDPSYLQFYDLNVEWNTTAHNGRVKCPGHFGNSDWYCWDGNYLNITCP